MSATSIFYVYEHWRPDRGACFYVGKGNQRRAWAMARRNWRHQRVQDELLAAGLSMEVRIVADNMTHDDAIASERARIALYGRRNLVNMTEGGEGPIGRVATPEHRAKISAFMKGRILPRETIELIAQKNRGRKASPQTKAKLSAIRKGKKRDPSVGQKIGDALRGKAKSAEHRAKCSAWQIGRKISQESIDKSVLGRRRATISRQEAKLSVQIASLEVEHGLCF